MAFHIEIAENDDNGNPQGWAERIQIGDLNLENTLIGGRSPKISFDGKTLQVGRIYAPASMHSWVGNMCWNRYYISWGAAMDIVNYLMRCKYWHCFEGPCKQFEKFNSKTMFNHLDIKEIREVKG